jgi:hypothetical protein
MQLDRQFLILFAALFASAAGGPADAGSDRLQKLSIDGKSAGADFSGGDACTSTFASVLGVDQVRNGAPAESYGIVAIYAYDFCNDMTLVQ